MVQVTVDRPSQLLAMVACIEMAFGGGRWRLRGRSGFGYWRLVGVPRDVASSGLLAFYYVLE